MKKILLTLLISLLSLTIEAQNYITVDRYDQSDDITSGDAGYYFKDTQGYLDQYLGNWQYESGNLKIQMRFVKKTMIRYNLSGTSKTDLLVGGMIIKKNNVTVLNTVASVNQTYEHLGDYYIFDIVRINNYSNCYNCTVPSQRIEMKYREPDNDNEAFKDMFFRMHVYMNAQNQPRLRLEFTIAALRGQDPNWYDSDFFNTPPTKTTLHLPFGTYDFEKID